MDMSVKDMKFHRRNIQLDLDKMQRAYDDAETNHFLHAIITIFTIGMWVIIWIGVHMGNSANRKELGKRMDESKLALMEIEDHLKEAQQREPVSVHQ